MLQLNFIDFGFTQDTIICFLDESPVLFDPSTHPTWTFSIFTPSQLLLVSSIVLDELSLDVLNAWYVS